MAQIRLTCRIAEEAHNELARQITRHDSKKGKMIVELMELVLTRHTHPKRMYPDNGPQTTCTLNVSDAWIKSFKAYREHHGLWENTGFFRDALIRGLSVRLDNAD